MLLTPLLATALLAAPNLLADGDFDRPGLRLQPATATSGWLGYLHGRSDAAFDLAPGAGRGGSTAARFSRTTPGSNNAHLDQLFAVEPETVYEVRAWCRGDGRLNPVVTVATTGWRQLAQQAVGVGTDWRAVRLVVCSYGERQLRFEWFPGADGHLYVGQPGTSFLDDVTVTPLADPPPALRQALALTRPRQDDLRDPADLRPGPVGAPRPLRPLRCRDGVLVYEDGGEVALWGVNFQTPLSWEYNGRLRPAGVPFTAEALRQVCDRNLDELAELGVTMLRAHLTPVDFTGADGSLRDSLYLDQLDYLLARCAERGLYVYLTLLNDMGQRTQPDSFMLTRPRSQWLFDPAFVDQTARYVGELLRHENRYSHRPLATEPALGVLELMNEPSYPTLAEVQAEPRLQAAFAQWCAANQLAEPALACGAWRYEVVKGYLTRLCATVRAAGARQPIFWNLNWPGYVWSHEDVFQATADSPVDGVSCCCYPGQAGLPQDYWNHPVDLSPTNFLPYLRACATDYGQLRWLLGRRFAGKAKAVYEFETFYNQSTYLYPAMARLFRGLGVQAALMWQYTLSPVAEYAGGSHYLNLRCTPRKAVSCALAGQLFATTPRGASYHATGDGLDFGDGRTSFRDDSAVLLRDGVLRHTRSIDRLPVAAAAVRELQGVGESPLASWGGSGSYHVRLGADQVDITLQPDLTWLRAPSSPGGRWPWQRLCTLDDANPHPFTLRLPGWAPPVRVERDGEPAVTLAGPELTWSARPGRYRLTRVAQ